MPLRPGERAGLRLPPRPQRPLHGAVPGADLRPAPRPHRPAHRGAAVTAADLILPPPDEGSAEAAARVAAARTRQERRYAAAGSPGATNATCPPALIEEAARPDADGLALIRGAADAMRLSARGFHRVLRVARTLADLDGEARVRRLHLAEALSYRSRGGEPGAAPA